MEFHRTGKLRSKLRDVFTHAKDFYQLLELHTDDPQYIPLAHEFEAALEVLDSLIGESGRFGHDDALSGIKQSLIRFKYDVRDSYPLQALLVTRVLDELERPDHEVAERC